MQMATWRKRQKKGLQGARTSWDGLTQRVFGMSRGPCPACQAEGCSFWGELVVHISLGETPCSEGWAFAEHLRPPEREPGLPSWASCTLRATQTPPSKWGVQRAGGWWLLPIKCRFHNLLPVPLGSINCVIFKGFDRH